MDGEKAESLPDEPVLPGSPAAAAADPLTAERELLPEPELERLSRELEPLPEPEPEPAKEEKRLSPLSAAERASQPDRPAARVRRGSDGHVPAMLPFALRSPTSPTAGKAAGARKISFALDAPDSGGREAGDDAPAARYGAAPNQRVIRPDCGSHFAHRSRAMSFAGPATPTGTEEDGAARSSTDSRGSRKARSMTVTSSVSGQAFADELASAGVDVDQEESIYWLASAAAAHPYMLASEIQALHLLFSSYASTNEEGETVIGVDGVRKMLDTGLQDMFAQMDHDRSGQLDRTEISELVQHLDKPLSSSELDEVMQVIDHDGSGLVDFEEFKSWWYSTQYSSDDDRDRELTDLFMVVDADGSGQIDWDEFLEMIGAELRREDSRSKFGKQESPRSGGTVSRDPASLLRLALESVRADIRSIYGSMARPQTRVRLRTAAEITATRRCCFFRPEGTGSAVQFRLGWDLSQILMLFYVAVAVPYRIGFQQEAPLHSVAFWWEVVVDVYFWIDIVINFRTAYFSDSVERELIVDQRQIALRYLKGWFVVDLLSCMPVTYIELALTASNDENNAGTQLKLFKVLRLLRLAKLLRLARLKRVLQRLEEEYVLLAQGSRVLKIVISILICAHFVACAWYYAGSGEEQILGYNELGELVTEQPWVTMRYGPQVINDTESVSMTTRYLDAMYYSVTTLTTVGYGDRVPHTDGEKVLSIFCELIGSVIFGIIAGSLGALAMTESLSQLEIKTKRKQLEEFMMFKKVPKSLRMQMLSQMDNWFSKKSVFDEKVILSNLPPKHRKELLMSIYKPYLVQCPLLQGMELGVMSRLCLMMRPYLAVESDEIVSEREVGEEMYLIMKGAVRLTSKMYPNYNERTWEDGAFFGELTVLLDSDDGLATDDRKRHVYTATAIVETDCTFISGADLTELDAVRPGLKTHMRKLALQRAERFGFSLSGRAHGDGSKTETLVRCPLLVLLSAERAPCSDSCRRVGRLRTLASSWRAHGWS